VQQKPDKIYFCTGGVLFRTGQRHHRSIFRHYLKLAVFQLISKNANPYLNTDAGTMNPAEHGEVFVTKDGAETDLDLGH